MFFSLQHTETGSKARAGILQTDHGTIETPVFMPVGTAATVKGVRQKELSDEVKAQILLSNTYHLYLRPGADLIFKAGGLHKFMNWDRPLLTDSGGYQVYSLSGVNKVKEEGVTFKSHIDGSSHLFSPESVMNVQRMIGADIMMAFDECTPYPCEFDLAKRSMELTHRWLDRSCAANDATVPLYEYGQKLFPIVQGSIYPELRQCSAEYIATLNRDGNAIGGLSVGEPAQDMYAMTELVCSILQPEKPRYLMGVGTPANMLESISKGIDMFDCVMPTRNGRNGMLFTAEGIINIRNEKWRADLSAIDSSSELETDRIYSKAYLRHLVHSGEMLGAQLSSLHNLHFYCWLLRQARIHILNDTFARWKTFIVPRLEKRL